MEPATAIPSELMVHIYKETLIEAPASIVWDVLIEQSGPGLSSLDGKPMNLKLEAWPGGRWFRDLGNNTGHLWGHVQVIKPPTLLELNGPMFMSYPVISHVQYRLTEKGNSTLLALTHRVLGEMTAEHRQGANRGWEQILANIKARARKK